MNPAVIYSSAGFNITYNLTRPRRSRQVTARTCSESGTNAFTDAAPETTCRKVLKPLPFFLKQLLCDTVLILYYVFNHLFFLFLNLSQRHVCQDWVTKQISLILKNPEAWTTSKCACVWRHYEEKQTHHVKCCLFLFRLSSDFGVKPALTYHFIK